jgi:hypothetical protein
VVLFIAGAVLLAMVNEEKARADAAAFDTKP